MGVVLAVLLSLSFAQSRDASQALLGDVFEQSEEAYRRGDFEEAFTLTTRAAEAGNAQAQFNLGVLYSKGQGTPRSYVKAVKWYLKAADQGHRGAMLNAAVIIEKGLAGEQDPNLAADLRRMAGETPSPVKTSPRAAQPAPAPAAEPLVEPRPAPRSSPPASKTPLLFALAVGALVLVGFLSWRAASEARVPLDGILKTICSRQATTSEAFAAFETFSRRGGDISAIPVDRLHEIFQSAGRESELTRISRLSPLQSLGLAKRFMESGRKAEALKLLSDRAWLESLPDDEFVARDALRLMDRLGMLADLPRRLAKAPAATSAVFGKALLWLDRPEVCAELMKARGSRTSEEERILALAQGVVASAPPIPIVRSSPRSSSSVLLNGKYELRRMVGKGGMGVVYEGYERHLDRKVAIKQMRSEIHADPAIRARFIAEARLIAKLRHPYIVAIHDVVEEGEELYLILDFVEGRTLTSIIGEKGRIPLTQCKELLRYVCEAVGFAHRLKVLHRDLKPDNVMVNAEGFPMVMDFGLARQAKETISRLSSLEVSGSPAYMPPEQHLGETTGASDVYALGTMLYQMLTGRLPFPGPDFLAQKERVLYTPPSQVVAGLSARCDELLARTLEPDPKTRLETPEAFYSQLLAA